MRKTKDVVIKEGDASSNRDYGKTFRITEMPASQVEKWGMRLLLLAIKSGVEVPAGIRETGGMRAVMMAGAQTLFAGGVNWKEVEPLVDELFGCVLYMPDPKHPDRLRPPLEEDIEEWSTRIFLRTEAFQIHGNFSIGALDSISTGPSSTSQTGSPKPPMSPQPSPQPAARTPHFLRGSRRT